MLRILSSLSAVRRTVGSSSWKKNILATTTTSRRKEIIRICSFSICNKETKFLSKVLIANRGEIACRIIRTCQKLDIPTVAIYSIADGPNALHAQMADEAYCIGTGPTPQESYLLINDLITIANETNTNAIHPGYGFLSENAKFAQTVHDNNIIFIGPSSDAITAMGSKSMSKEIMTKANVPITPGYYNDTNQDIEHLYEQAKLIGFPILIKAIAGGGGKGMRIVWNENDFKSALQSCQREAMSAVGNDLVLLEKYLIQPRHVEVQIIADTHDNVVHLYERDCSLQRRHQKIIEEAPASDLHPDVRNKLGEMGKRAAKAVGYVNAGTVEFLLDTQSINDDPTNPDFYFCEMNTRLQVEHPITEAITGIDLVEWQLRVAAGQELPITNQADIPCIGHAFEARIYAENPTRNFLPATGQLWYHNPPCTINTGLSTTTGNRVDTGLQSGQNISVYYDPMISKLIVHDKENREKALQKLINALKQYQIAGVPTNIDFLIKCAQHPIFNNAGAINTGFLDDYGSDVQLTEEDVNAVPDIAIVAAAMAVTLQIEQRIPTTTTTVSSKAPWSSQWGSWRMGGLAGRAHRTLHLKDGTHCRCISNRDGSIDVILNDDDKSLYHVNGTLDEHGFMKLILNHTKRITIKTVLRNYDGMVQVRMWPETGIDDENQYHWAIDMVNPMEEGTSTDLVGTDTVSGTEGIVKAPMPGKISRINFNIGDTVMAGDVIMIMEAMKMEHACSTHITGIISDIKYKPGDVVDDGTILFIVTNETTDDDDNNNQVA